MKATTTKLKKIKIKQIYGFKKNQNAFSNNGGETTTGTSSGIIFL